MDAEGLELPDVPNPALGIYAVHADGSLLEKILDLSTGEPVWGDGGAVTHFDVSPDSSRIAYSACAYTQVEEQTEGDDGQIYNYEIAVANIDGTAITRLTENTYFDNFPAWSPDGNSIAFISDKNSRNRYPDQIMGQLTIHTLATGKSRVVPLPNGYSIPPLQAPIWSPDGQKIAFVVHEREDYPQAAIYTVRPDGSELTRVSTAASGPAWSPDGSRIAVVVPEDEDENGEYELNLYVFCCGRLRPRYDGHGCYIAYTNPWVGSLSWSPDGAEMLLQDYPGARSIHKLDPANIASDSLPTTSFTSMGLNHFHGQSRPAFCTIPPSPPQFADWSPDGSRIATRWGRAGLENLTLWGCGPDPAGEIWINVRYRDEVNRRTLMEGINATGSDFPLIILRLAE